MLINNEFCEEKIQSPLQYTWSIFKTNSIAFTAMWGTIILIFIALFADFIAPETAPEQSVKQFLLPPYWAEGGNSINLLGTDAVGRDYLTRLLDGIQLTLGGALLITLAVSILGTIIGASAALTRGIKASILHHLLDTLLMIPTLILTYL